MCESKHIQRCNNCMTIFDEELYDCPNCENDEALMFPFDLKEVHDSEHKLAPIEVIEAFNYVESFFPELHYFVVGVGHHWHFMYDNFDSPNFNNVHIDFDILNRAINSVKSVPAIFYKIN